MQMSCETIECHDKVQNLSFLSVEILHVTNHTFALENFNCEWMHGPSFSLKKCEASPWK